MTALVQKAVLQLRLRAMGRLCKGRDNNVQASLRLPRKRDLPRSKKVLQLQHAAIPEIERNRGARPP